MGINSTKYQRTNW